MHANLAKQQRALVLAINDDEAIRAAFELTRLEGIIPALESAHALGALDKMRFKPTDIVFSPYQDAEIRILKPT